MLTKYEIEEIGTILKNANLEELLKNTNPQTSTPISRRFKTENKRIWFYYLPDFSKLAREFFSLSFKKMPKTLDIEKEVEMEIELDGEIFGKGIMTIKYPKDFVQETVEKRILSEKSRENNYISYLLKKNEELETEIKRELNEAEYNIKNGKINEIDAKRLFETLTDYSSIILDKVFPYKLFKSIIKENLKKHFRNSDEKEIEQKANEYISNIFIPLSVESYLRELSKEMLNIVETIKYEEKPNVEKFRHMACTGTNDLITAEMEKDDNIEKMIKQYQSSYPTINSIIKAKDEIDFERTISKANHYNTINELLSYSNTKDVDFLKRLIKFAEACSEHNETRRRIITRSYKVFRTIINYYRLDLKETPISKACQEFVRSGA